MDDKYQIVSHGTSFKSGNVNDTTLEVQDATGLTHGIVKWPTYNCQVCSYIYFIGLTHHTIGNQKKIIKDLFSKVGKRLMIIDVNTAYENKVENLFPVSTHLFKNPYKNTNGSSMTMYLINIKQAIDNW